MESEDLSLEGIEPKLLDPYVIDSGSYDYVISLKGPLSDYIEQQPLRSTFLEWDIGELPNKKSQDEERFRAIFEEITQQIHQLIKTLRGEEAT
jgi:protein-tyrosine-phosphatase